jgi:hypothetical protein
MPTKKEMAKTIVELFNGCNNIILSFEEFIAIVRQKGVNQNEGSLRQLYDAYCVLQEEFGLRGPTDTEEQLNSRNDEELEQLWQKVTLATHAISFLHDNSPEEQ